MFRKSTARSIVSTVIAGVAIVGIMYSCSSAETSSQKKATVNKYTHSQTTEKTKTVTAMPDSYVKNKTTAPKEERQLAVYYFMTTYRCPSCHFIEETTRKAINESFANEIKSGRMVFKTINIEEKGNGHFTKDYKLYTKSVILSDTKDSKETRWTNLDKVWQLIGNEPGFKAYIVKEIKTYLGA